ncbi:Zn(II)2Cys6 transcription factor [Aspergillus fijiensis CBS 313.89]|uniref:Zn(2)-C6 fungal-type domain-containing protein n=1 Tax=Aspergillus fijiensis CBS 313.89 TaxID=1448319 RepID=A0A8G1RYQ1_9EURO|nr:uncharacterized protein BO72DRAFT_424145 [Aspergillus fijiensis CBS 313.89]RAK80051.1 hypothetical protein BO72DRAFT_424145 [Aspergillus fijiensis CBS 313.89]
MSTPQPVSRRRVKARTGCLRCKQRRIKCDETVPACTQCTRKNFDCPGYRRPLKWSSKYEVEMAIAHSPTELQETMETLQAHFIQSRRSNDSTVNAHRAEAAHRTQADTESPFCIDEDNISTLSTRGSPTTSELMRLANLRQVYTTLEDDDTTLLRHYFSKVCPVNSCFDSHKNFFRMELGALISSRPLIHSCVLAMSAAHLTPIRGDMVTTTLTHRSIALACLKAEIEAVSTLRRRESASSLERTVEMLLGSILLGMTEGWHDPMQLGITHLYGARVLYRKWLSASTIPGPSSRVKACPRTRSLITGLMVYWEAVTSFVHNQPLDATAYLATDEPSTIYVNPWTGIGTRLFACLAKIGTLTRHRSLLRQTSVAAPFAAGWEQASTEMAEHARSVETTLLHYQVPGQEQIEDTVDARTPVDHLQRLARIYQQISLLQLYMTFPDLDAGSKDETLLHGQASWASSRTHRILTLATNVLAAIGVLPTTSGVFCLLTIPLIIAGSALQIPVCPAPQPHENGQPSPDILSSTLQEDTYLFWRNFVRERIETTHRIIGVAAIPRAQEILDRVWFLSDVRRVADEPCGYFEYVQWTEVMVAERLETIFG